MLGVSAMGIPAISERRGTQWLNPHAAGARHPAAQNGASRSSSGAVTFGKHRPSSTGGFVNVKELRELLGHDVLLLAWPKGSNGTKIKWGHLTVASMTPAYLEKLERGNIGVALGKKSGNLIHWDVDDDNLVHPILSANPFLKATLQSEEHTSELQSLRHLVCRLL